MTALPRRMLLTEPKGLTSMAEAAVEQRSGQSLNFFGSMPSVLTLVQRRTRRRAKACRQRQARLRQSEALRRARQQSRQLRRSIGLASASNGRPGRIDRYRDRLAGTIGRDRGIRKQACGNASGPGKTPGMSTTTVGSMLWEEALTHVPFAYEAILVWKSDVRAEGLFGEEGHSAP